MIPPEGGPLGTPTRAQLHFGLSPVPFPAFVGGFGSGKTHAAILRLLRLKSACVGQNVAYYLPTYDLVSLIAKPRLIEALETLGIRYKTTVSEQVYIPEWKGSVIFRNMADPARIVGYQVAHSICDELDTLAKDKAAEAWNKIIARNRQVTKPIITDQYGRPWPGGSNGGPPILEDVLDAATGEPLVPVMHAMNSVAVATTPEGFRFVYERWVKKTDARYRLYRAKTMENPYLPRGYVSNLRATYPAAQLQAYLDGEFVNLQAGAVYFEFRRDLNACDTQIIGGDDPETLHIGMDFNVGEMAAVVYVLRDGNPHAVAEHVKVWDTPAMIQRLNERYPRHQIHVYPDASSQSRRSNNASQSDLSMLYQARNERAGWTVHVNSTNPFVKDRVLSMNRMIHNQGERRLRVNVDACPTLTEALEQQAYDKAGEPDKTAGHDHVIDAAGYPVVYRWPIAGNRTQFVQVGGL